MQSKLYKDVETGRMVDASIGDDGVVKFSNQGGGFVRSMGEAEFLRRHNPAQAPVYAAAQFSADFLSGEKVSGYSNQMRWNGWAQPCFPKESGLRLCELLKGMSFDDARDAFVSQFDDDEPEVFAAEQITVEGQSIKVYPIGAGCWCWDELEVEDGPAERPRN